MKNLKIGILEFGMSDKENSMSMIEDIFVYANKADELGYSRFWLTEHHRANPLHPYNNPEILISIIAGMTDNIRVGSAGSLVGYYSPYSLVQNYKLLNNIYNNRIDFGLSKGIPENSHLHDFFSVNKKSIDYNPFFDNLNSIYSLLYEEEKNFEEKKIIIPPFLGQKPSLWYLSNSYSKIDLAIKQNLNICRSLMHGLDALDKDEDLLTLELYKKIFLEYNKRLPEVAIAIALSFTRTKEEIEEQERIAPNREEAIKIIPVEKNTLLDTIKNIQKKYNVNEIIICDTELNINKKNENLKLMKKILNF